MDLFSWFRRRRAGRNPHTSNREITAVETEVRIPLTPAPFIGFVVYFRGDDDAEISPAERDARVTEWLEDYCPDEALRADVLEKLEEGLVSTTVHRREDVPEPPDEMVRAYNPGETEERRYRNATHIAFVGSPDVLAPPRAGLWSAIATARTLAATLPGGVLLDPEFPRVVPLAVCRENLPAEGQIHVVEHILIPYSNDPDSGLLWITTKGMERFGLPDLEMKDVPSNLATQLMPVLNGIAQHLIEQATAYVTGMLLRGEEVPERTRFTLTSTFRLDLNTIARAYGDNESDDEIPAEPEEAPGTDVRLVLNGRANPREDEMPPILRILPPVTQTESGMGIWLNRMLAELFGTAENLMAIERGSDIMEKAHERALQELPLIRQRFQAGFQSGEVLHVKYGFPTGDEGHEYMWVVVATWQNDTIYGNLANDPQYRTDLRAGQSVEVPEKDIYDWLITHRDGRTEGAYTNRALLDEGERL